MIRVVAVITAVNLSSIVLALLGSRVLNAAPSRPATALEWSECVGSLFLALAVIVYMLAVVLFDAYLVWHLARSLTSQ